MVSCVLLMLLKTSSFRSTVHNARCRGHPWPVRCIDKAVLPLSISWNFVFFDTIFCVTISQVISTLTYCHSQDGMDKQDHQTCMAAAKSILGLIWVPNSAWYNLPWASVERRELLNACLHDNRAGQEDPCHQLRGQCSLVFHNP